MSTSKIPTTPFERKWGKITVGALVVLALVGVAVIAFMASPHPNTSTPYVNVVFDDEGYITDYTYTEDDNLPGTFPTWLVTPIEVLEGTYHVRTELEVTLSTDVAIAYFNHRVEVGDPIEYKGLDPVTWIVVQDIAEQIEAASESGEITGLAYYTFGPRESVEIDQEVVDRYIAEQEKRSTTEPQPVDPTNGHMRYEFACTAYSIAATNTRDFLRDVRQLLADAEGLSVDVRTSYELEILTELPCDGAWVEPLPDEVHTEIAPPQ